MTTDYPIIVGVGQKTYHPGGSEATPSPLEMMEGVAREAERDAGASGLLAKLDSVRVVNIMSWPSADPPADLAARLGAGDGERGYSTVGGNTPQWLVNDTAEAIARGNTRLALLVGGEAVYTVREARKRNEMPQWEELGRPKANLGDRRRGFSDMELKYGGHLPIRSYPLFENAIRAHHGWTMDEHVRRMSELAAGFAAVAKDNPHAWFRDGKSASEIGTTSPVNRMICFPYTKFLNAIMEVDQAAAVLMTSESAARELGIPEERWIYLHGCGDATDLWFVSERANYHESPGIRAAGKRALDMAGVTIDDVAHLDLYSCFPCAVQLGRDALGIAPDDPRPLTVTGGLAYAGGPANNYTMHAIANMVERLRAEPDDLGLVSGLGWYVTKHAIGVYGAKRPSGEWERTDPAVDQAAVDAISRPELVEAAGGPATIEAYTVVYGREGIEHGVAVGRLEDGRRCMALTPPGDTDLAEAMTQREFVGERITVRHDSENGVNHFTA